MSHEDLKEMLMEYSTLEVNIKWIEELQIQDLNSLIGIENDELQWGLLMERLVDADLKYILQRWRNDRKCLDQLLKSTIPRKIKYANKKPKTTTTISYCIYLSLTDDDTAEASPKSNGSAYVESTDENSQTESIEMEVFTRPSTRSIKNLERKQDSKNSSNDFYLDFDSLEYVSAGFCGKVFKTLYKGDPVALKICDIYNNPLGLDQILHEVKVYEKLVSLQGSLIPKLIFYGYDTGIFVLMTSFIRGHPCTDLESTCVQNALKLLGKHGVRHLDIRKENIIVRDDGSICVLDFGLSEFL